MNKNLKLFSILILSVAKFETFAKRVFVSQWKGKHLSSSIINDPTIFLLQVLYVKMKYVLPADMIAFWWRFRLSQPLSFAPALEYNQQELQS